MRELHVFVKKILSDPVVLFKFNKNKVQINPQQVEHCFEIIRHFAKLDPHNIKATNLINYRPFCIMDNFNFHRSNEFIQQFICASNPQKPMVAVLINRNLHMYNYINKRFMFKINIANFSDLDINQTKFLIIDNDQILIIQDGESRFMAISIAQQKEIYLQNIISCRQQDITLKIDPILTEHQNIIDMGFGVDKNGDFINNSIEDQQSDESDEISIETRCH